MLLDGVHIAEISSSKIPPLKFAGHKKSGLCGLGFLKIIILENWQAESRGLEQPPHYHDKWAVAQAS